jgi:L-fucose isomerase-like protein
MVPVALPTWLHQLGEKMARDYQVFGENKVPNHVLINEYLPGDGIMV